MQYVISSRLLGRLRTFVATHASQDIGESVELLQDLTIVEADPVLSSLLWTKMDLVAEFRGLLHGANPRNPDGTCFDKTLPFDDPIREQISNDMAGNVDDFCLGIRNDIDNEIAMTALEMLRSAVIEQLESMGIDTYAYQIPSDSLIADSFAHLSPGLLAEGFQPCVRHVAREIKFTLAMEGDDAAS